MTNSEVTPSAIMAERRLLFQKVAKIFLPFSQEKSKKLYPQGELNPPVPFVHYTSAESALSILKNKRFWMRNTQCMADFREVQYGHDMFFDAFNRNDGKLRSELIAAIDDCSPKAADAAIEQFDKNWPSIQRATYVTCLSEHDESEDQHGRLSMWRAFAPNSARVAIVLRIPHFSPVTEKLRLMFSPVGYLNQASVDRELERVIKGIRENAEFLRWEVSPDVLYGFI